MNGKQVSLPFDNPAERLFRSIKPGWIDADGITTDAIDLAGSSCNRESIAPDPAAVIDALNRPQANGVASITAGDAHGIVQRPDGEPWEFYPAHCPEHGNDAHAEIRVHRNGSPNATDKIGSSAQRLQVKTAIAKRMAVLIVPTVIDPADEEFG